MHLSALVVSLLLAISSSSSRVPPRLWGGLAPGPYAVGFRQLERYDRARVHRLARDLEGRPRVGERARPIRISVWYPAEPTDQAPMTWGDYAAMVAGEARFGPLTGEEKRRGEEALFRFPLLSDLSAAQRTHLSGMPTMAVRGATPAPGKFPLILYSLGSAVLGHVTPEYLASHGYVVVQSPRLGAFAGLPPDNRDAEDIVTKVRDIDFLINAMTELPFADAHALGAVGFSAGGRWALSKAMENPDVRAVVSLDSVMLFQDATTEAWKRLPWFQLGSVRVPVLHMIRRAWVPREDPAMWDQMRYANRTSMVFEDAHLDHLDFQSIGYALTLVGLRQDAAPAVTRAFPIWNRYTLEFFDAHLKGNPKADDLQTRASGSDQALAGFVSFSRRPAEAAPLRVADVLNAIDDGDTASVERAYRRLGTERGAPPIPEDVLNAAGYNLLFSGRVAEGIGLLELNTQAFPASANAWDSLSDAYLAAGDLRKAQELAGKARALLDTSPGMDPERKERIRKSIDEKLKRISG